MPIASTGPGNGGGDYHYGAILGEIDYFTHSVHGVVDWYRNNELVNEEGCVTTLLGQDAVKLIDEHDAETPLFLYLAFTAPHAPYQALGSVLKPALPWKSRLVHLY
jgi:hypothetical protein